MKHAREDYNRIQDPENLIPENEPVFLIRGKDKAAPFAVEAWAAKAESLGADENIVSRARAWAKHLRQWQKENGGKVPDMPNIAQNPERSVATAVENSGSAGQ